MTIWELRAELIIDDVPRSLGTVGFLYQRDPDPGGHRYVLQFNGADALHALPSVRPGITGPLDRQTCQTLFHEADWLLAKIADVPRSYEFFLNSVEVLEADHDRVTIRGTCSPIRKEASDALI